MKRHIPNFLTLMNLLCGVLAIMVSRTNPEDQDLVIALLISGSLIFDFFDGMVARMLGVHSEIGKQLDSLADVVSFGVVPGVVAFNLMVRTLVNEGYESKIEISNSGLKDIVLLAFSFMPLIIPLFSALRLAKFNIDERQSESFIGVPTPANAIFWISLPLILLHDTFHLSSYILNPYILLTLVILTSYLLVARIPLFSLKFKNFSWHDNKIKFIFLLLTIIIIPFFLYTAVPIIILLYIILSLLNNLKLIK